MNNFTESGITFPGPRLPLRWKRAAKPGWEPGITLLLISCGILIVLLSGCSGVPTARERDARTQIEPVARRLGPGAFKPTLPQGTNVTLAQLLSFALVNQPKVVAAYFDYAAAVEQITLNRSLPDPRLTFELDIQEVVMTLMPGLMLEVPWAKRLRVRADTASAESEAKYRVFEQAVLQAAYDLKRSYYQLYFLEERLRILKGTRQLLAEVESAARGLSESGKATLQDVIRSEIEQERLDTEIQNLQDSRAALLAQYRASLGLIDHDPEAPFPRVFETTPMNLPFDRLREIALRSNPRLIQMQAELEMAETSIRLARLARMPDFSLGIEADAKASPVMWRPSAGMTLPIWRDKIAAELAAAQARKSAAQARLSAEEIQVAVDFAEASFQFREASRSAQLLSGSLLAKARQTLEISRASYSAARSGFLDLLEAERQLLEFQLSEIEAMTRRELAAARLQMVISALAPAGAPLREDQSANHPAPQRTVR
jgi:outer membrane protein TolC